MRQASICPKCQKSGVVLDDYESLIMISESHALFTVTCRLCGARVTSIAEIPESMHNEIQFAAIEVGAGMGRDK